MEDNATTLDLKAKIFETMHVPVRSQRLLYSRTVLADDKSLIEQGVTDGAKVTFVLNLRGD